MTLKERLCVPSALIFCCVYCVVLCIVNIVCCIVLCLPSALISGKRQHGAKGRNDLSAESHNMWNVDPSTENQRRKLSITNTESDPLGKVGSET